MRPFRIAGAGIHLAANRLECFVIISKIGELGWAHKTEVGRIEEEDRPLTQKRLFRHCLKLAVVVCGKREIADFVP